MLIYRNGDVDRSAAGCVARAAGDPGRGRGKVACEPSFWSAAHASHTLCGHEWDAPPLVYSVTALQIFIKIYQPCTSDSCLFSYHLGPMQESSEIGHFVPSFGQWFEA